MDGIGVRALNWNDPAEARIGTCRTCGEVDVQLDNDGNCEPCAEQIENEARAASAADPLFDDMPLDAPTGTPAAVRLPGNRGGLPA